MSIHFISGKPGGGKSLYAMKLLVEELRLGKRCISTNLPVDQGRLAEWLHEKYGSSFGLHERLRLLGEKEAAEFWRFPTRYVDLTEKKRLNDEGKGKGSKTIEVTDHGWRQTTGPVLFIIDEAHVYFNARRWQETGDDAVYYLSQHRHLGDDCIIVTQHVGNVEKQFRVLAQDFTYIRNHAKEKIGFFKSFGRFTRRTYLSPATGAPGETAMERGTFTLDVTGLASCYDTASGVGIHGRAEADQGERRSGLPFWALPAFGVAGVVAVVLLLVSIPKVMGGVISSVIGKGAKATGSVVASAVPAPPGPVVAHATAPPGPVVAHATAPPGAVLPEGTNSLRITGVAGKAGGLWVCLSDGRAMAVTDRRIEAVGYDSRGEVDRIVMGGKEVGW